MELVEALLAAPDREAARRVLGGADPGALGPAVESLASHVLRFLRVEPRRALEIADRAELAAEGAPEGLARARARWVRGHALAGLLRNAEAIACYEDAAREYARRGKKADVARIAIGQVNALTYLGRYREAIGVGERARGVLRATGQKPAAARMDLNLGNIYHRIEKPRLAVRLYERARRAARAAGDPAMIRVIDLNRATALSALGRLDEAERLYREVRVGAELAGESRVRAFVDFNLGYILFQRGSYGLAYDTLDSARQSFEALADDHFLALTWIDLAELFLEVNAFPRAADAALRASRLAERLGLRFELGRATLFAAIARLGEGDHDGARRLLERAATIFREEGNESSEALAATYLAEIESRAGDFEGADARLAEAAATFRRERMPLHEATALVRRGANDRARGRLASAGAHLAAARQLARRARSPWLDAQSLHEMGRAAEAGGDAAAAKRLYRRAIARVEAIRGRIGVDEFRISFADDKAPIYADLDALLLEEGAARSVDEAFSVAERARSRALCDLLAGRLSPEAARDETASRLLGRLERIRSEINRLSAPDSGGAGERRGLFRTSPHARRVREREAEMTDVLRRLQRRSAQIGGLAAGETASLAEARRDLPADTTLVEYFLSPRGSWAFLVQRGGARAVRLPVSADEIARRASRLRFTIEKCSYGDAYSRSRGEILVRTVEHHLDLLAEAVWAPLELRGGRVLLVPHGPLHAVPFAALPLGAGERVVDRFVVTHLPSATSRRFFARPAPPARELSVLAVEAGDASIPETAREIDEIRRAFRRGTTLRRPRSTRDGFRRAAQDADVIHIATHGVFRPDDPAFSSLQMDDGWMGLHDIYALRLRARLVCLSACPSGRAGAAPGDELVGLARGFLHAGAASLLVSLWPVDDRSTSELMTHFYRGLRAGGRSDDRLAEAMRAVRARRPEPYHWASFVLIGGREDAPLPESKSPESRRPGLRRPRAMRRLSPVDERARFPRSPR